MVMVPLGRGIQPPDLGMRIIREGAMKFRIIAWVSIAVLIVIGVTNLLNLGIAWEVLTSAAFWSSSYGKRLIVKLSLVAAVVLLSMFHDFILGPRAARLVA